MSLYNRDCNIMDSECPHLQHRFMNAMMNLGQIPELTDVCQVNELLADKANLHRTVPTGKDTAVDLANKAGYRFVWNGKLENPHWVMELIPTTDLM